MKLTNILFVALIALASTTFWKAHSTETKIGSLMIQDLRARATAPEAPVGAGYLTIMNMGEQEDVLIRVNAPFAGQTEIHEIKMDGDVAKMRPLQSGLKIPAGQSVNLTPGGLHLMFMDLQHPLKAGDTHTIVLHFKYHGEVSALLTVRSDPSQSDTESDHHHH